MKFWKLTLHQFLLKCILFLNKKNSNLSGKKKKIKYILLKNLRMYFFGEAEKQNTTKAAFKMTWYARVGGSFACIWAYVLLKWIQLAWHREGCWKMTIPCSLLMPLNTVHASVVQIATGQLIWNTEMGWISFCYIN